MNKLMNSVNTTTAFRVAGLVAAAVTVLAFVSVSIAGSLGRVVVKSTPSGASVVVGSRTVGTTPADLRLPADGGAVRITLRKDGYKSRTVAVKPKSDKTTTVKVTLKR